MSEEHGERRASEITISMARAMCDSAYGPDYYDDCGDASVRMRYGEYAAVALSALRRKTGVAIFDVIAERERQQSVEGWTAEHDDKHIGGVLALAAACYATNSNRLWPWSRDWWKPKDRRRDLVRAGALILAEIDRLDRAEARGEAK